MTKNINNNERKLHPIVTTHKKLKILIKNQQNKLNSMFYF